MKGGEHPKTSFFLEVTNKQKMWSSFQAIGDIAFAYSFATVLIEIEVKLLPKKRKELKLYVRCCLVIVFCFYLIISYLVSNS